MRRNYVPTIPRGIRASIVDDALRRNAALINQTMNDSYAGTRIANPQSRTTSPPFTYHDPDGHPTACVFMCSVSISNTQSGGSPIEYVQVATRCLNHGFVYHETADLRRSDVHRLFAALADDISLAESHHIDNRREGVNEVQ